jgi:nucleoside-diphosphate-sugar epimerase
MKQRLVILGCGYLGFHLANYFDELEYKVVVLGKKNLYASKLNAGIEFVDSALDKTEVIDNLLDSKTIVIYAIGSINATNLFGDIVQDINNNYFSFINLLNVCSEKQVKKFVFLSSAGTVYGNNVETTIDEETPLNPINIYGLQKVYFEHLINIKSIETGHLPYYILRISNPYGGFQNPQKKQGIIPILIHKALNSQTFDLWADINTVRDYIYIEDFLHIFKLLLTNENGNAIINIGSGTKTSIQSIIKLIESKTKKTIQISHKNVPGGKILSNTLNINNLVEITGFKPQINIEDGISKLIDSIESL